MRGLFITGTDTGVGKTAISAALLAAISETGERVRAFKPVVTGIAEAPAQAGESEPWPADHELLARAADMSAAEVSPHLYPAAVSPHLAARLVGETIDPAALLAHARRGDAAATVIVEGVGGLLVPLTEEYSVRDLALALGLPIVIVARPDLGTINHTLLTIESARAVGLHVAAVVLNRWPAAAGVLERSNRSTISQLGQVEVATFGELACPTREALARAGQELPWRAWLGSAGKR
ncbi:MAG TPA: dethiobiotin synthase [Solirubrobacteraceae bacterium]